MQQSQELERNYEITSLRLQTVLNSFEWSKEAQNIFIFRELKQL